MKTLKKPIHFAYHNTVPARSKFLKDPDTYKNPRYIEYRKNWTEFPKKQYVSEFPLHLDIEATNDCNLNCPMCFRYIVPGGINYMDFELFKKIIDEGKKYNLPSINLSWGGESFLHPKLIDMIKYAKKNNIIDIRINSNGTLINEEIAKQILASGIDKIIFSFDAGSKELFEKIRLGANYDLVIKNIRGLIEMRDSQNKRTPVIDVQMVHMKENQNEVESFIKLWEPYADNLTIVTYQSPNGNSNDARRITAPKKYTFPCPQIWQRLSIASDEKVFMCCGDYTKKNILGDLKTKSLYDIWHGDKLNSFRKIHAACKANSIEACKICDLNKTNIKK